MGRSGTPEEHAARQRGIPWRLEERIRVQRDPERQQVLRAAARRGAQTRVARAREKGVMPPTSFQKSPELAREARRKSAAVRRALLGDPEYRAWLSERCSEGKCGRIEVACAGCGARFELTRSAARDGERHFCGEPCLRAFRRAWAEELERRRRAKPSPTVELVCRACGGAFRGRVGRLYCSPLCRSRGKRRSREVPLTCRTCGQPFRGDPRREFCSLACHGRSPRPDARAKMRDAARRRGRPHLEELRAMAADAFAGLPDLPRRVVRLYYGLEDGGPRTQREIARMCGVAQVRVQPIVAEAVERLLQSTRS